MSEKRGKSDNMEELGENRPHEAQLRDGLTGQAKQLESLSQCESKTLEGLGRRVHGLVYVLKVSLAL